MHYLSSPTLNAAYAVRRSQRILIFQQSRNTKGRRWRNWYQSQKEQVRGKCVCIGVRERQRDRTGVCLSGPEKGEKKKNQCEPEPKVKVVSIKNAPITLLNLLTFSPVSTMDSTHGCTHTHTPIISPTPVSPRCLSRKQHVSQSAFFSLSLFFFFTLTEGQRQLGRLWIPVKRKVYWELKPRDVLNSGTWCDAPSLSSFNFWANKEKNLFSPV